MKTEMKAILASVVVIALCLAAVSGVTYSWFSDSEKVDVSVTAGTIDIEGTLTTSFDNGTSSDTQVSIDNENGSATITNLVANRNIDFSFTVTNSSTIDTIYRAYVTVTITNADASGIEGGVFINGDLDGIGLVGMNTDDSVTSYFVGTSDSGIGLEANTNPSPNVYNFSLTTVPELAQQPLGITISVIAEAFQTDYEFVPAETQESTLSSGSVEIGNTVSGPVSVSGTPSNTSIVSDVKIDFTEEFSKNLAGKTVTVSEVTEEDSGFGLISGDRSFLGSANFTISDTESSNMGLTYVSMTVDGEYSNVEVYYFDNTSNTMKRMNVTDISASGGKTTVTFITTHFSTYTLVGPMGDIDGTSYYSISEFESALNTGSKATLYTDINENITITNATNNLAIDLNGHTINSGENNTALIISGGHVSSVTNGKLIGKNYGIVLQNDACLGTLNCDVRTYHSDAIYLKDNSTIENIAGGIYYGFMIDNYDNPTYENGIIGNFGLYIGSNATVKKISGGEFQGTSASFRNYGTIEEISGGTFLNPLIDVNNTMFTDTYYDVLFFNNKPKTVTGGTFFNGQSELNGCLADGYSFQIENEKYVTFAGVTSHGGGKAIPDGTIYYYTVVASGTS